MKQGLEADWRLGDAESVVYNVLVIRNEPVLGISWLRQFGN